MAAPAPYPPTYPVPPQGNGFAVTSLVLGILAIVLCWVPVLNWLLAAAAIIFGAIGLSIANKRQSGKGMAIAGLICGVIGGIAAVVFALLIFTATRVVEHAFAESRNDDVARLTVKQLAHEAYPMWSSKHPDAACPATIADLEPFMQSPGTQDPWGHPYKIYCGQNLPAGAKIIAIVSVGPDGVEGTADDIKSW